MCRTSMCSFFCFNQKTAYELRISDWSSDVCSSDLIATGGQGEPRAALARMAGDVHQIKLEAGDTVVFSSKQIPGNEIAIGRIMNQLAAKEVLTVTEKQAHIHVSGHPGKPELAALYGWLRPKLIVPVHGEIRHMHEQARFAVEQ